MYDHQLKALSLSPEQSINAAMECIDRGACGIALVVDEESHLLGTITDGDVRRAILAGKDLKSPVSILLASKISTQYPKPITARLGTKRETLIELLHKNYLYQLPILDNDGKVVDLVMLDDLIPPHDLPLQAVIMAGGLGTRLKPLTDDLPKPMLHVGGKPLMELVIEQLREVGIRRVNVTTHYKPEKIFDHFGDGSTFGVELNYVNEDKPLGTGGALGLMDVPTESMLVINGDILTDVDFRAMLNYHRENHAVMTVAVRQYDIKVPYGVIECKGSLVSSLKEKPQMNFLVNAGVYLLEPKVYEFIPNGEHFNMTDLIQRLLDAKHIVASFPIIEYWLDIGQLADYEKAQDDVQQRGKSERVKFPKLSLAFAYLWYSKKIWCKPRKAKILIIDRQGSNVLLTYLDPKSVEILDIGGESLNLYVLFKCLLHWKFSLLYYSFQYLACVKPSVALTFIDNNILFYQLKGLQKNLTTIFVQNGVRAEVGCVLEVLKKEKHVLNKYQVDYMLTFGNAIGKEYAKYISGKVHPIGSFKNNLYKSETQKQPRTVLFLSQYRPPPNPESDPMFMYYNQPIFWKQMYSAEAFLLPLLQQYCQQNKLELKICGSRPNHIDEERSYFITLLGDGSFEFLERTDLFSSYKNIAAAEFVVFTNTTLGYEVLASGKKTAAFTLRGKSLGSDYKFGWPADLPDSGPFWTNHADEHEFKRVMDYITTVSDEEWEQARQRYVPELIEYDPGNTRFLKLMREIGVPLREEYQ